MKNHRIQTQRPLTTVGLMVLFLSLAACSSGGLSERDANASAPSEVVNATSAQPEAAEPQTPASGLPLTMVFVDEAGPADLNGMFEKSTYVMRAKLVEVNPGLRYYGPDAEAPDATAFEQVELVFAPVDEFKGDYSTEYTISIPWTAYITEKAEPGATRLERVAYNGLTINEDAIGQQYGIFVDIDVEDGQLRAVTSEGIVPLDSQGKIASSAKSVGHWWRGQIPKCMI